MDKDTKHIILIGFTVGVLGAIIHWSCASDIPPTFEDGKFIENLSSY